MPITPPGIGVISSIHYRGTNLESNFRRGVHNDAWCDAATPRDGIGYDDQALKNAVGAFNSDSNVGLIVTVGGVVCARAALQVATKPFISLIGDTTPDFPGTITGYFYGGFLLRTFKNNDDRLTHLTRPPHRLAASEICLLSNPLSAYATTETSMWPSPPRGPILRASNDTEITSALDQFTRDNALKAIVISADPFFQDHKDHLVTEANKSRKRVLYPLQIYAEATPRPRGHTLHGPKLATAYHDLGAKARNVIDSGAPSNLESAAPEVHDH